MMGAVMSMFCLRLLLLSYRPPLGFAAASILALIEEISIMMKVNLILLNIDIEY